MAIDPGAESTQDTLFSPLPRLQSGADGASDGFIASPLMQRAAHWDERRLEHPPDDIAVVMTAAWLEPSRAARAIGIIDLEIRRCAQAWARAMTESGRNSMKPCSKSSDRFLSCLEAVPAPIAYGEARLETRTVTGPPVSLLAEPCDYVWMTLYRSPAATVAYAMAAFGAEFSLRLHSDCKLESATFAQSTSGLHDVIVSTTDGDWRGSDRGRVEEVISRVHRGSSNYRAIAEYRDEANHVRPGIYLSVLRTGESGNQDLATGWA